MREQPLPLYSRHGGRGLCDGAVVVVDAVAFWARFGVGALGRGGRLRRVVGVWPSYSAQEVVWCWWSPQRVHSESFGLTVVVMIIPILSCASEVTGHSGRWLSAANLRHCASTW